jgi:hypothetical protein
MEAVRTGGIGLNMFLKARVADFGGEHTFSGRGPADVSGTNEENLKGFLFQHFRHLSGAIAAN